MAPAALMASEAFTVLSVIHGRRLDGSDGRAIAIVECAFAHSSSKLRLAMARARVSEGLGGRANARLGGGAISLAFLNADRARSLRSACEVVLHALTHSAHFGESGYFPHGRARPHDTGRTYLYSVNPTDVHFRLSALVPRRT